jgi:N-acetylmuramoyl-L-alanine amidase CwlA
MNENILNKIFQFLAYIFRIVYAHFNKNISRSNQTFIENIKINKLKIEIEKNYLTPNKYSRSCRKIKEIRGIVIHWPGSTISLDDMWDYFESMKTEKDYRGAHALIGKSGRIVQQIPDDEIAYHCGAKFYKPGIQQKVGHYPNAYLLGIEACVIRNDGRMSKETKDSLFNLVLYWCRKYNLVDDDLYIHSEIVVNENKKCHRWYYNHPLAWRNFKKEIKMELL